MIEMEAADDRDAAAGEYVLGMLGADDRVAFEAAMVRDDALQSAVYDWQDRLLPLSVRTGPVAPRPQLWQRIDIGLTAVLSSSDPKPRPSTPPTPRDAWWRRLAPWQALSAFAVAASLVMGVVLVEKIANRPAAGDRYLALLQSPDDRSTGWVVEVDAGRGVRLVPVVPGTPPPAGKSLQFWTKPQGAAGPTSLGLVRAGERRELPVAMLPGVGEQQLFEITLEPEGGSPLGRPTGPILYVGRTVHL